MSLLNRAGFRIANIGVHAVRRYAAAVPNLAFDDEPISTPVAGPSRLPPHQDPLQSTNQRILKQPTPSRVRAETGPQASSDQLRGEKRPRKHKPKSRKQIAAALQAKAFAKALKAKSAAQPPALPDPDDVQYRTDRGAVPLPTNYIEQPTLGDLLARQPAERARYDQPNYPARYEKAYDAIDYAFVLRQLRPLARLLGLSIAPRESKPTIVSMILAHWGWPPPEKGRENKTEDQQDFDMESAELFLLIRNEKILRSFMQGGMSFEIIQPPPAPQNGIVMSRLRAKGTLKSNQQLAKVLSKRSESRVIETIPLAHLDGWKPTATLLSALPKATDSFIEMVHGDTLRVTSNHAQTAKFAVSLLTMAAMRGVPPPADKHTTAIMLTSGKQSADGAAPLEPITLSPFQLPSAQPLPWDVASAVQLPALARIRRSLQWAAAPSRIGEVQRREDMEKAKPVIVSGKSQPDDLAALAQQCIEGAKSSGYGSGELNTLITIGHALDSVKDPLAVDVVPVNSRESADGTPTVSATQSQPIFIPARPPSVIQYPFETSTLRSRQLTYRKLQNDSSDTAHRFAIFRYDYIPNRGRAADAASEEDKEWQSELDEMMRNAMRKVDKDVQDQRDQRKVWKDTVEPQEQTLEEQSTEPAQGGDSNPPETEGAVAPPAQGGPTRRAPVPIRCEIHTLSTALLRLPDRPVDAHLAARSITVLPPDHPLTGIREFFRSVILTDQFVRPLEFLPPVRTTINIEGTDHRFVLCKDEDLEVTEAEHGRGITLRTVKTYEAGLKWATPLTYTELEVKGDTVPIGFWRSLAEITRDVPPNAGVLEREIPSL